MGTQPASATIVLEQPLNTQEMSQLVDGVQFHPGVITASGRAQFTSDIHVNGQPRDIPLQVFVAAPDDPMQMAKFQVQQGSWPPPPGEIFIGRDTFNLMDVSVGDTLTLTTPAGAPAQLKVAGSVYDPSLAPAPQEQTGHAYLSSSSLTTSPNESVLDQLKIQVSDVTKPNVPSPDRNLIVSVAGEVAQWLQGQGLAVREIQVPDPYGHPHQWQVNSLLLALLTGGVIALVLSVLLVANMLNGLFTQQIPQIGIMKTIGARSGHIMRLYLSMTLLVALAATLLALAPAIVIGRALLNQMFGFLGILPSSFEAPAWTYVLIVAVGLGLPPLMALIPLVTTSRTTVRAAIDHHGAAPTPSTLSGLLAWLTRLRRADRGLLLALRNTTRRPARFLLSAGLLASAGSVFVAGMSLSAGVQGIADQQTQRLKWDVDVQLAKPAPVEQVTDIIGRLPEVRSVEGWSRVQTGLAGLGALPVTRTHPDQGRWRSRSSWARSAASVWRQR